MVAFLRLEFVQNFKLYFLCKLQSKYFLFVFTKKGEFMLNPWEFFISKPWALRLVESQGMPLTLLGFLCVALFISYYWHNAGFASTGFINTTMGVCVTLAILAFLPILGTELGAWLVRSGLLKWHNQVVEFLNTNLIVVLANTACIAFILAFAVTFWTERALLKNHEKLVKRMLKYFAFAYAGLGLTFIAANIAINLLLILTALLLAVCYIQAYALIVISLAFVYVPYLLFVVPLEAVFTAPEWSPLHASVLLYLVVMAYLVGVKYFKDISSTRQLGAC